jgi:hypothetical protein
MAEYTKQLSQDYWRPAPSAGKEFQTQGLHAPGSPAYCTICGTQYAAGARFCHLCGLTREDDPHTNKRAGLIMDRLDLEHIRERTGLSTISLALVSVAAIFLLATAMTGFVYNTSTIAEWQAVQTWRIEWLLAAAVALLAAILFKTKS